MLYKTGSNVVGVFPMFDFTGLIPKTGIVANLTLKLYSPAYALLKTFDIAAGEIIELGASGAYYCPMVGATYFTVVGPYFVVWVCAEGNCENMATEVIEIRASDITTFTTGLGSSVATITVDDGVNPLEGVTVEIWNAAETTMITWGMTDIVGQIVWALDDANYKAHLQKSPYAFDVEDLAVAGATADTYSGTSTAPAAPVGATICRVYDWCFMPDGVTPMAIVDAKARIVSLPEDLGGLLLTGEVIDGIYNTETGLVYWDVPQTSQVQFTIQDFGIRQTETIPEVATVRLSDIA